MKRIPQDFIIDLIARTNIVEVIDKRVKIKKRGSNHFGCCPFHNEKTASFSVSEKKQIFYCFGCGVSGSVINFLMQYERLSYPEAIEELASFHGIHVPYIEVSTGATVTNESRFSGQNTRKDLYALMAKLVSFYQHQLTLDSAQNARSYLEKRGLNQKIIDHYKIGYSPNDWSLTSRTVANSAQAKKLYDQAGMLVTNDTGNQYDRFRARIMFPIRDRQGNVIAFGGRTLDKDERGAKYLNSPETTIFRKGYQLYGLYEVLEVNRNPEKLLVVEGYMDVVSLAQYDINYAVAALGTATTEEHIKLLFRATDNVVFCYDGDEAGRRAAWRALSILLPALVDGKQIKFVFLPEGEDPDSLVRNEGKEQFETRLNNGLTLSQFLFDELLPQTDLKTSEGKAKLSSLALPLIAQVSAPTFALNLKKQLGDYLGYLDITQMDKLLEKFNKYDSSAMPVNKPMVEMKLTTMRILIGLLLQYPELAKLVPETSSVEHAKLSGIDLFIELLAICHRYPNITTAQILSEYVDKPILKQLNKLATWEHQYPESEIKNIFTHTLKELYDNILSQRQDELIAKERVSGLTTVEKKELAAILLVLSKKD